MSCIEGKAVKAKCLDCISIIYLLLEYNIALFIVGYEVYTNSLLYILSCRYGFYNTFIKKYKPTLMVYTYIICP